LNIFEPRYLTMLSDALKTDHRLIGMIQPREMSGSRVEIALQQIGCAGRVTSFSETEDGRYMITLSGISRFRIETLHSGFTPYICGDVNWTGFSGDLRGAGVDAAFNRPAFLRTLSRFFESKSLSTDWSSMKDADAELLINSLSMLCPFGAAEKQALLEARDLAERRKTLVTLMEFALAGNGGEDKLQ
jgi:Lon protease-like protein